MYQKECREEIEVVEIDKPSHKDCQLLRHKLSSYVG